MRLRINIEVRLVFLFFVRKEVRQRLWFKSLLHNLNISIIFQVLVGTLIVVAEEQRVP